MPQGISAELIADKWGLTRDDLDAFGVRSQQYARRATDEGRFEREILPVLGADGAMMTHRRGPPRHHAWSRSAQLKPAFRTEEEGGRVTAGNSSQITDGAVGDADHERGEGHAARPHAARPLRELRRSPAPTRG